jgi:diaminopimelate epimerase
MIIPFVKMHGLGNDFVIIDQANLVDVKDLEKFAIAISDRRLGVGCDQFISYSDEQDNVKMSIYNQDGSKAKACGNASRCLSRLIYDKTGKKHITLNVDGRKVVCEYTDAGKSAVDMGEVSFAQSWMPEKEKLWDIAIRHQIEPKEMICVDVGNPHLVIFSKLSDQDKAIIGENFQENGLFADGVNVSFAKIQDDKIFLKVWERGAGFTYACGSGAVATFAAANKLGFIENEAEVIFELGNLNMKKIGSSISMSGQTAIIYQGHYFYE